jgi:oligopeptide transport system substrate-binding protein
MIGIDAKERDMNRPKLPLPLVIALAAAWIIAGCARQEPTATTLNLSFGFEPPTLDPAMPPDIYSIQIISELFPALTEIDDTTSEALPRLATQWQVSDDGLVWTFRLRDDVYWVQYDLQSKEVEKKRQVTAHDVEYAVKRTMDPSTASPVAYGWYVIQNAEAVNTGASDNLDSVGVEALDDFTVQFTLEQPTAYFPKLAAFTYPMPREPIDQHGPAWTEAGNMWSYGPFMLAVWEHQSRLVLAKNPHYYDAQSVTLETVNMPLVAEPGTQLAMYDAGELDTTGVPNYELERLRADPELSKQLRTVTTMATAYLGFNLNQPPLDNRLVRKALSAAIDRQKLVDDMLKGGQVPARCFCAPGVFGSPAEDPSFEGITFNPEQARAWLAEAGYLGGEGFPETTFMFSNSADSAWPQIAQFVQKEWSEHLNIDVQLAGQEWKVFLVSINSPDPPPMWGVGWLSSFPDAHTCLYWPFHPTKGMGKGAWDAQDPAAQRFMAVTEAAAQESDPEKRQALYFEAETILCQEEAIVAPLFHASGTWITKPYVERTYGQLWLRLYKWKVLSH